MKSCLPVWPVFRRSERILLFGDSMALAVGASSRAEGYPSKLRAATGLPLKIYARSGADSLDGVRWAAKALKKGRRDTVVWMLGFNEAYRRGEAAGGRLHLTLRTFLLLAFCGAENSLADADECAPVVLVEPPRLTREGYASEKGIWTPAAFDIVDRVIADAAASFGGYPVCIARTNDFFDPARGMSPDHQHPNDRGYSQITAAIVAAGKFRLQTGT